MSQFAGTVAVTGGTGFIGSAIVDELKRAGWRQRVLLRSAPNLSDSLKKTIVGNLSDNRALLKLLSGANTLVHAASYVGSDRTRQWETNVQGTRSLCVIARKVGIRRIIYVSTCGVYGSSFRQGISEGAVVPSPRSTLSMSRLAAEKIVLDFGGTVLRPQFVIGVGDLHVLSKLILLLQASHSPGLDSSATTSVINRKGVAEVVRSFLGTESTVEGVFHVANPDPTSLASLAENVMRTVSPATEHDRMSIAELEFRAKLMGIPQHKIRLATSPSWICTDRLWSVFDSSQFDLRYLHPDDIAWYGAGGIDR